MDLKSKNIEKRWVDYDDKVKFCVRPHPFSLESMKREPIENLWERFNYCCVDWKGINMDGKPFECNEANKKHIFDYYSSLATFVLEKAKVAQSELEDDLKNL